MQPHRKKKRCRSGVVKSEVFQKSSVDLYLFNPGQILNHRKEQNCVICRDVIVVTETWTQLKRLSTHGWTYRYIQKKKNKYHIISLVYGI